MNKHLIWVGVVLAILVIGFLSINSYFELKNINTVDIPEKVIEKDFEGEADPSRMTLGMKTWNLEKGTYGSFEFTPPTSKEFTITFREDGTFSATTDCNGMGGRYTASGDTITFGEIAMTQMYCEDSREAEFASLIGETFKYRFTSKGELIFELKSGTGSATFR